MVPILCRLPHLMWRRLRSQRPPASQPTVPRGFEVIPPRTKEAENRTEKSNSFSRLPADSDGRAQHSQGAEWRRAA
jgi:hypothetical protein